MTTCTHEQNVVLQIQRDNGVDEESLQAIKENLEMGRTISNLQKMVSVATELLSNELYTKPAHCVLEILQNADDNLYDKGVEPELRIKLRPDFMEITCNEIGFQDAHVRAFCGIRQSTKKNQAGYIGEKGIGAKSIFKVARRVTIRSREYAFELDKERQLGMITPVWVSGLPSTPGWTNMRLELVDKNQFNILKTQLLDIRSTVLLFLRKLNILVVDDGTTFHSTKSVTGSIISLDTRTTASSAWSRLASKRYLRVPHSIAAARDDEKRQGQTSTAIILAFPLGPNDEPLSAPYEMVYAFLPLRQAGFRFLLQADFLTAANREDILTDRQWNVAIRDAVSESFVDSVDMFKATPGLRHTWFRFLPREYEVTHPFFSPIVGQINTQLRELPIVWTDIEDWCVPSRCCHAGPFKTMAEDENETPLVQSQYLVYDYASDVYAPDVLSIICSLGVRELSYPIFLDGLCRMHAEGVFTSQPPEWLEDVCDKALIHGIYRGKGKDQFFQNEGALRGLPLVQRRDGSWSTCQKRQTSAFFFDASDSSFPSGLSIEIISKNGLGPRRQQLLGYLGVRDVNVSLVVENIISLHRSSVVSVRDISSHLQYLFKNRHSYSDKALPASLWLIESTGQQLVRSANAYIESTGTIAKDLRLSSLFHATTNARFLHPSLVPEGPTPGDSQQWRSWLTSSLGVATAPRLKSSGLPSSELEFIIKSNQIDNTGKLLSILRTYMSDMLSQSRSADRHATEIAFYNYLSRVEVRCTNGRLAPLGSTYVLSESIKPFATEDLLVLPLPDLASDWKFLKKCGVSLDVNADFFLKKLRSLATQDARSTSMIQVNQLYRQLESRFHELSQPIWDAFRQEPLIFIGSAWWSTENVVWDGPPVLTLKRRLKLIYPNLVTFFRDHLGIADASDGIVASELRQFALTQARKPLSREDVDRLRRLLVFGSDTIEKVEKGDIADWTISLREEAILPIHMPNSEEIRLASVSSGSFYVPDPSGFLANVFAQKVAFIDLEPFMVIRMQPLLARLGIDNRRIDKFVTREVTASGAPLQHFAADEAWNTDETSFFVHKLPFLERAYYFTMKERFPVKSALVFKVDKLDVSYTLTGGKVLVVSSPADCWSLIQDNKLLIFLSASLDSQDYHNYPVAGAIASALGMRNESVALIRSILHDSDRDVASLLRMSGIHEIQDHLRQTFEEPTEASKSEDVESLPHTETAHTATAAKVATPQRKLPVSTAAHSEAVLTVTAAKVTASRKGQKVPNVTRSEVVPTPTAAKAFASQRDPQVSTASHSETVLTATLTATMANVAALTRNSQVSSVTYSDVAFSATTTEAPTPRRGAQMSLPQQGARPARLAVHETSQSKRDFTADRSWASSEKYIDSRDRLEARHLERWAEKYKLQPAVTIDASVRGSLTLPLQQAASRTIIHQWGEVDATNDLGVWDDAALNFYSDQPDGPAVNRIGFLGENFAFQLLSKRLPGFGVANWTSNVRAQGGHPPYSGEELADFVYQDVQGVLTSMLFPGRLDLVDWQIEYFIEVKSTTGAASEPFHLSRKQFEHALSMTQSDDGQPGSQIYVLFRVSHIGIGDDPQVVCYADPHQMLRRGALRIVSNTVEVRILDEEEMEHGWD